VRRAVNRCSGQEAAISLSRAKVNIELAIAPRLREVNRLATFERNIEAFIARRIRTARVEASLTQEHLAGRVEISPTRLSRIERGARAVTVAELIRFAIALRRPLAYFTYPSDDETVGTGWEPVKV